MGKAVLIILAVIIFAAAFYFVGPRVAADTHINFDPAVIGSDPDAYLTQQESRFTDIGEGLRKSIVWAYPASKSRTPLALVYVHGFSASSGESRPLIDIVGADLGANIFYTRLTGHARGSAAMAEGTVKAWVNDLAEAIAVGRAIGDQVIIISMSTGAGLAAWGATRPELMAQVQGMVLISPNFAVKAAGSSLLAGPWGRQLANLIIGPERSFQPKNELNAQYWTSRYPTEALLPMAALVKAARNAPVETTNVPALFIFSDSDTVVDHTVTRQIAKRWGAPHAMQIVEVSGDPDNHVIVGDAISPATTGPLARRIGEWIRALP